MKIIDQDTIIDSETTYKSQISDGICKGCVFDTDSEQHMNPNGFLMCAFQPAPCLLRANM